MKTAKLRIRKFTHPQSSPPLAVLVLILYSAVRTCAQVPLMEVTLDAREAPQGVLHANITIPVKPGSITLHYPKWIPGEHGPTGPVRDLVDLRMKSGGEDLEWKRDALDLYTFRTIIPAGRSSLDVSLSFLLPAAKEGFSAGRSSTENLAVLSWHYVLLYPAGKPVADVQVRPRLIVPEGWKHATALRQAATSGVDAAGTVVFQPVSLATLVDSPVLTGRFFRELILTARPVPHKLHIAAESEEALRYADQLAQLYRRLVQEELAVFGNHPYGKYDFLLAVSDHIALFGLEHHESSDNRVAGDMLLSDGGRRGAAGMLAHELAHAWNGKARRPAGMVAEDYQRPLDTELLWVYEGLTDYLEAIIPVRAGLWSETDFREHLAFTAASQAVSSGRTWRSLADVSMSAQMQFEAPSAGSDRRRAIDFYDEASLIWLEADVMLRRLSGGKRSLDDFCRKFFGKPAASVRTPDVSTYAFDDLVSALNDVAKYDWRTFFRERVERRTTSAPLGGIEGGGWKLAYTDTFPERYRGHEEASGYSDFRHSLGMVLRRALPNQRVQAEVVLTASPAAKAGLQSGMHVVAVNGNDYTADRMRQAIRFAAESSGVIEVVAERDGVMRNLRLEYSGGERYPTLERDETKPDILSEITRSRAD